MIVIILIKCSIISSFTQGVFILEIVLHPPSEIRLQNYGKLQACKINLNHNMLVICNILVSFYSKHRIYFYKTSQLRFLCTITFYHIDGNVKTAFFTSTQWNYCLSFYIYLCLNKFFIESSKNIKLLTWSNTAIGIHFYKGT